MLIHHKYVLCFYMTLTNLLYLKPQIGSLDNYALMRPSFCLFRYFSVTMEPHCALKAAKHLCKNKTVIIITLMSDLGLFNISNIREHCT